MFQIPEGANINRSIPHKWEDDKYIVADKCQMYDYVNGSYGDELVKCRYGYTFNNDPVQSSVVTDVSKY